jgi:hypothetical protein
MENQADGGWLRLDKLVEALDVFYTTHSLCDKPRWSMSAVSGAKSASAPPPRPPPPVRNNSGQGKSQPSSLNKSSGDKSSRRCFVCNSSEHLANFHKGKQNSASPNVGQTSKPSARVMRCGVGCDPLPTAAEGTGESKAPNGNSVTSSVSPSARTEEAACNKVLAQSVVQVSDVGIDDSSRRLDGKLAPLEYLEVKLCDGFGQVQLASGLVDSGAQMAVVHADVVRCLNLTVIARVKLRRILGPSTEADVVRLGMRLTSCGSACENVSVLTAVSSEINDRLILPTEVVNQLLTHVCCVNDCVCVTPESARHEGDGHNGDVSEDNSGRNEGSADIVNGSHSNDDSSGNCESVTRNEASSG